MILMLNNRDSFVFNLARYLTLAEAKVEVEDSRRLSLEDIRRRRPEAIVISPGPSGPEEAGISVAAVKAFGADVPILGVCLGHQAIAVAYGGSVRRAKTPLHGRAVPLDHDGTGLFDGLPSPLSVGLYHSLIADLSLADTELRVDARAPDGEVMALSHPDHPVFGIQFHPESILTEHGQNLLANFLNLCRSVPCP
ncbi:anthranilate synthase component II [Henriciella aquimarina]|uniref:anthranilate synthase component II n=1 Tax=Henriciella aquimarina TaxID=545261 RepID=UPI000A0109D9|nr:aminodeoxychorismate/anthranilate synthase component II [Henriciella aquimarina]